jgi:hypothetical protein
LSGDGGAPPAASSGRSTVLVAASLVGTSVLAAAQALALLVICGTDPRTEPFLAGYALYLPIAVLGSSLRATVSALVADAPSAQRAERARAVVSGCMLFGALVVGALLALVPLLAPAISAGLPADVRGTTASALLLLLPAAFLHITAAALAGALAAGREFGFSAAAYVVTGVVSIAISVPLLVVVGPLGAGCGVLAGSLVLAAAHLHRARSAGIAPRLDAGALRTPAHWRLVATILTGAGLGFALQANLAISIAALGEHPGAITAYSYAFFLATMILALSSLPLALVSLPDLVAAIQVRGRVAVGEHIARIAPYAYAVVLPLALGFVAFGRPLLTAVLDPFVARDVVELMYEVGRALVPMTIPATLFYLASAASLPAATPRGRLVHVAAAIGVHVIAVALVWGDAEAVAWAHCGAMVVATAVLLAHLLRRELPATLGRVAAGAAPVVLAAAPMALIGIALGSDASPAAALIAAAVAVIIYVLALQRVAPAIAAPFAGLLRRSSS